MKKSILFVGLAVVMALTSCSKLKLTADNFKVTPTPLEAIGGQVPATITANFPEKCIPKKAVVVVTPVLKYEGGEAASESATFQGQKVEGNGTSVQYKVGGTYSMKANWAYQDAMLKSDLYARFDAKVGKKVKNVPDVKIGYGILATAQLLSYCTITGATAPDAYQRIIAQKQEANIKFLINQANLRTSETGSISIQDLVKILKEINDNNETRALQNIEVSAYASPDGKYDFNEKLAEQRQDVSDKFLKGQLKKIGMDADIDTKYTAEDWDGFQQLISQSNLQDKEVILRVLSMYQDPEEREQQIRNMSSVYTEIADGILPELRRARLLVNYEVIGRSDAQILAQFAMDPSKLSVEELLYGANRLLALPDQKAVWYSKTQELYPSDYRAFNNYAQLAIMRGDAAQAETYLNKAAAINANAPEVNANKAVLAMKSGDVAAAEQYMGKASGSDTYQEIQGALNIARGNYSQADRDLSGVNTNSAALAQIMNKNYAAARSTLANVKEQNAVTSYLKAVLAARVGDSASISNSLKDAVAKDPSLAKRALNDVEFQKYSKIVESICK
ncbi:MAG: hypothetical protein J6035_02850 [Bacteroidaceae bacterium]|nr:hypothetical protein [Bacteroidaceae bacterium]